MQKNGFDGMAGEYAAAKSGGNGGNRPSTHTTGAFPWPATLRGRMQSAGSKSPAAPPRRLLRGGASAGRGELAAGERITQVHCSKD